MVKLKLTEIATMVNGECHGDDIEIQGIAIDSNKAKPGHLFIAIRGERLNGHDYIAAAQQHGATAALVSQPIEVDIPYVKVDDTVAALGKLASQWRQRFTMPVISVTGSNGKTTTKNMLAAIFTAALQNDPTQVLVTQGNYNNHIGCPYTLLHMNSQHKAAIIEMGMNHHGEIAYLTKLTQPQVAIITNAGPCHLAGVGNDIAQVAKAKGEIYQGLKADGIGIINADDKFADYWRGLLKKRQIFSFGIKHRADLQARLHDQSDPLSQVQFTLQYKDQTIAVTLPLPGEHNVMNALAAAAGALAVGLDLTTIKQGLENLQATPGRLQRKRAKCGCQLFDDTYNANPRSLQVALDLLTNYSGRTILILGDMGELGDDEQQVHAQAGEDARTANIDLLFAVGDLSRHTVASFGEHGQHFADHASLIAAIQKVLRKDDLVLIKGSRFMKMEQIVKALVE